MLVTIKVINGAEHCIEIAPNETIEELKKLVEAELKIPVGQQRLMYKGKPLSDLSVLKDCNIQPGTKIHLSLKNADTDKKPTSPPSISQAVESKQPNKTEPTTSKSIISNIEVDTPLNSELKNGLKHFNTQVNVNQFVNIFNSELEKLANELSLDDIERYNQQRWAEEHPDAVDSSNKQ